MSRGSPTRRSPYVHLHRSLGLLRAPIDKLEALRVTIYKAKNAFAAPRLAEALFKPIQSHLGITFELPSLGSSA